MLDNNKERDITIYLCTFTAHVSKANVLIKFPCTYYLEWKTANAKRVVESKSRPTAINSVVAFNQTLQLTTEMVYDHGKSTFVKKQTMLNLNLISKSRQDQVKLIGRVTIDLAEIANRREYEDQRGHKLCYCSVDAQLFFSAALSSKKIINMNPQDLDKSSFNDYFSLYSSTNSPIDKCRRDVQKTENEETSIALTRNTQENIIDIPSNQHRTKPFNQTFFMLNSPITNRTKQFKPVDLERNFNRSDLAMREESRNKQTCNSRSTQQTTGIVSLNIRSKAQQRFPEESQIWERERVKVRGQIEGNREKIEELQRKIAQLCFNLQDSKRHLQVTQRQNKEKDELIKSLRIAEGHNSLISKDPHEAKYTKQYRQLQAKTQNNIKQRQYDERQWRSREEMLKSQINQFQSSNQLLRKETDQLRKVWQQKKDHYQEKIRNAQSKVRSQQQKINDLTHKIQDLLKYKYQYELVKQSSDDKDDKLKSAERALNTLKAEIQQINKHNYAEEVYKLKIELTQQVRINEELEAKLAKSQQEVSKHKENYTKMQTAYHIQINNYENSKEKYIYLQTQTNQFRQENQSLRNHVAQLNTDKEILNQRINSLSEDQAKLKKQIDQTHRQTSKIAYELQSASLQKQHYRTLHEKAKQERQSITLHYKLQIQKLQHDHHEKQSVLQTQKFTLEESLGQLATSNNHLQSKINRLQASLSQLNAQKERQLAKKQAAISALESAVADKQQIIKMYIREMQNLKEGNNSLQAIISQMRDKEVQLQKNIMILEEEANKILYILDEKQRLDKEMEQLSAKYHCAVQQQQQNLITIQRYQSTIEEYSCTIMHINSTIEQLKHELHTQEECISNATKDYNQAKAALEELEEELAEQRKENDLLRESIKDLNEKVEQHLRQQQMYNGQLTALKQQKQQLEIIINKNSNQFASYNQQLQEQIQNLQKDIQTLEMQLALVEEDKNNMQIKCTNLSSQNIISQSQIQQLKILLANSTAQIRSLSNLIQEKQLIINGMTGQKNTNTEDSSFKLYSDITALKEDLAKQRQGREELQKQLQMQHKSFKLIQQEKDSLNDHLDHLKQCIEHIQQENKQTYNQLIQVDQEIQIQAANSILQDRRVIEQQQTSQILAEKEDRIKMLQGQVEQFKMQIRNLIYQLEKKPTYHNFTTEEMGKIIDEQRKQIQRLQHQIHNNNNKLENRVKELQAHILELSSSFKLQIDRMLASQPHKEEGGLSVISQENEQDFRTERSLSLPPTPNKAKMSFLDQSQIAELQQKLATLQSEKQNIQNQLETCEQQKFDLLTTLNEKEMQLSQTLRNKMQLQEQIQRLRSFCQVTQNKLTAYQAQLQSLRNQVNFGSSIFLANQHSVTRSQPVNNNSSLCEVQNKEMEIENLRAEVERYRVKEEQLVWTIKDMQMQLQTVTNTLNTLNSSHINQDIYTPSTYEQPALNSKQRLMESLRRNSQLKELTHQIIRKLQQQRQSYDAPPRQVNY